MGATQGINALSPAINLPLVQDTTNDNAWSSWEVAQRDVWILDQENIPYAVVNLSTYSLATPANFHGLKDLMIGAAAGTPCSELTLNFENQGDPISNINICR